MGYLVIFRNRQNMQTDMKGLIILTKYPSQTTCLYSSVCNIELKLNSKRKSSLFEI